MAPELLCGWRSRANGRQAAGRQTAADGAAQVSKNTQAPLLAYMCHIVTVIFGFPPPTHPTPTRLFTHGKFRLGRSHAPRIETRPHPHPPTTPWTAGPGRSFCSLVQPFMWQQDAEQSEFPELPLDLVVSVFSQKLESSKNSAALSSHTGTLFLLDQLFAFFFYLANFCPC